MYWWDFQAYPAPLVLNADMPPFTKPLYQVVVWANSVILHRSERFAQESSWQQACERQDTEGSDEQKR